MPYLKTIKLIVGLVFENFQQYLESIMARFFATNSKLAIYLLSPEISPHQFEITIKVVGAGYHFTVREHCPKNRSGKTCCYILEDRQHQSYLIFYSQLATNFSLRNPKNKHNFLKQPSFEVPYIEVITENLTSEIRYGYGDPAVIRIDNGKKTLYYLLVTSNDAPNSFPILRSKNLTDWESVGFVFPEGKKPHWAVDGEMISDFWAPEMHQVAAEFRVYFVARDKQTKELCIGKAVSTHPEGPFIPDGKPILKGNVIDPHIYVSDEQTTFLYWKEDNNDVWPSLLITLLHEYPQLITILFEEIEDQRTASFTQTL